MVMWLVILFINVDVFFTVHHSIDLFQLPTLMYNSLFINNLQRATIPDAVRIKFVLLKMGMNARNMSRIVL